MAGEDSAPSSGGIISVLQNGVRALNGIWTVVGKSFPQVTGTATSATAGAATLPSNPAGFIVLTLPDGSSAKVPFYD